MCWGAQPEGIAPPPGAFSDLAAGSFHTCGLRPGGAIVCWGNNDRGQLAAPAGGFVGLIAGFDQTCATGEDGAIVCWGDNSDGQLDVP